MRAPQNGALGSGENKAREQGCRRAAKLVHPAAQKRAPQNRVGPGGTKGQGLCVCRRGLSNGTDAGTQGIDIRENAHYSNPGKA